ncbi:hypothetical protein [Desulfonatronovibrio hydrogenovorans]|uniref:hypothetical protein n=1 Tax=Desulfonatronovibrio hydrogenovorans TaxID=53245 RepID=UPI00049154D1|nr:hypothetical protein [Desulfonatronovibrio hydrogenovorans]
MSSLRYQKMTSWPEYKRLHKRILASNIDHGKKMDFLRELQQFGRRAVPGVAQRLKQAKKEASCGR